MKQKILILLLLLLLALVCGKMQAQDTVRERDSIYYFMPHGRLVLPDTNYDWRNHILGRGQYSEYHVDNPMLVYGIAIVSPSRPQFLADGWGGPNYISKYYDTSSLNLDLYAVLIMKEGGGYYRFDSVKWYPRNPNRYLEYEQVVYSSHDTIIDTTIPVYEFYFQTPRLVVDTFYVGLRSNIANYDAQRNFIGYSYYLASNHWIEYAWRVPLLSTYLLDSGAHSEQRWLGEYHCIGYDSAYYGLTGAFFYGAVFPIIVPPADTDAVECIPVQNFRRTGYVDGRPLFAWDRLGGQQTFQISYGPADQDPDSHRVVNASAPPFLLPDRELDSTVLYAARCRARCHHTCPLHDTIVWSPWSDTVQFFTGSRPAMGIGLPTADAPSFTLSPNPARGRDGTGATPHGQVTVTLSRDAAPPCVVTLRDEQGRTLQRHTMEGRTLALATGRLAAGLYLVTLDTPQGSSTQKLVVE